eukprot:707708-Rhodomonas_salina.6
MADLKWAMDMHGRPDAMESKPAAVTFAGQMITLTYDKAKRGLRRCEFEPFSVWAVPLQGTKAHNAAQSSENSRERVWLCVGEGAVWLVVLTCGLQ